MRESMPYIRLDACTMDFAALIQNWGYPAVFAGSVLEGETILALAAIAAHRGYLALPWVIAAAAAGGFLGDQAYFLVGRFAGDRVLARWPALQPGAERVRRLLDRYDTPLILGVRFLYGLRTVGPIAIGMSSVSWVRFALFNLIGAIVWAALIAGIGYALGEALTRLLGDLKRVEEWVFGLVLIGGLVLIAWLRRRGRRAAAAAAGRP
jgi:membrane protein DedA with SNARE-associated domain